MPQALFYSAFGIGETVLFSPDMPIATTKGEIRRASCWQATVVGVQFNKWKVTYDLDLQMGGEPMRAVDSTFVHAHKTALRLV